jgi:peptidoglycan/LPS O-acetylase OafA/YrhL
MGDISQIKKVERLYDVDWLRIIGVLSIFLFHCSHYFDFEDWHVKNQTSDVFITIVASFIIIWVMPLIFIISGISTKIMLGFQKPGKFIKSRVFRLLLPLVFGIFILTPHQVYIERFTHGDFIGSLFAFLPHYFDGLYGINGNFGWMGLHLWYLEMLFFYSIILLPLFLLFRRDLMTVYISRFFSKPGTLYIIFIPLAMLEIFQSPDGLGMKVFAGWGIFTYMIIFVLGYLIFSSAEVRNAAERQRLVALTIALLSFGGLVLMGFSGKSAPFGSLNFAIYRGVRTFCMVNFLITIIGFANRYLKIESSFLGYSNEAVLPFYMLHQSIIVAIGFFIIDWSLHPIFKWLFLIVSSFVVIMLVYHFVVRPINPIRFLFGMKMRKEKSK